MLFLTRTLPFLFCFAFGVISWIIYYVPHEYAQTIEREFALWLRLVFAFAYVLGLVSLLSLHWTKIRQPMPFQSLSSAAWNGPILSVVRVLWDANSMCVSRMIPTLYWC